MGAKPVGILGVVERYENIEIRIAQFPGAPVKPSYLKVLCDNFVEEYERRAGCATMYEIRAGNLRKGEGSKLFSHPTKALLVRPAGLFFTLNA